MILCFFITLQIYGGSKYTSSSPATGVLSPRHDTICWTRSMPCTPQYKSSMFATPHYIGKANGISLRRILYNLISPFPLQTSRLHPAFRDRKSPLPLSRCLSLLIRFLTTKSWIVETMDVKANNGQRFTLGKQSSLAPDRSKDLDQSGSDEIDLPDNIDAHVRLMYLANEGDIEGIQELMESGVDVNFRDIDGRTALHVAACQGQTEVVRMLLEKGAQFDSEDRWGSTVYHGFVYCFFSLFLLSFAVW